MLHYVELRIEDYQLTSRSLRLNSQLFGIKNDEVVRRMNGTPTGVTNAVNLSLLID
jgi:hypothetical protein